MLSNPVVVGGKYRTDFGETAGVYYVGKSVVNCWRVPLDCCDDKRYSFDTDIRGVGVISLCEVPDATPAPSIDWSKPVKQRGSGKRIDEVVVDKDYVRYRIGGEWYSVAIDGRDNKSCEGPNDAIQCTARPWAGPADVPDQCEWVRLKGREWFRLLGFVVYGMLIGRHVARWDQLDGYEWTDKRSLPARPCVTWE